MASRAVKKLRRKVQQERMNIKNEKIDMHIRPREACIYREFTAFHKAYLEKITGLNGKDKPLSFIQIKICLLLTSLCEKGRVFNYSYTSMAKALGVNVSSLRGALNDLEDKGYLTRMREGHVNTIILLEPNSYVDLTDNFEKLEKQRMVTIQEKISGIYDALEDEISGNDVQIPEYMYITKPMLQELLNIERAENSKNYMVLLIHTLLKNDAAAHFKKQTLLKRTDLSKLPRYMKNNLKRYEIILEKVKGFRGFDTEYIRRNDGNALAIHVKCEFSGKAALNDVRHLMKDYIKECKFLDNVVFNEICSDGSPVKDE